MADECRSGAGSTLMAFILGAAVGGGLAILFAPRSGRETRDRLRQLADEARARADSYYAEAEGKVRQAVDESTRLYEEKKEALRSAAEAGRKAFRERKEAAVEAAEAARKTYRKEQSEEPT